MKSLLLACLCLFASRCLSQTYLEPMLGYGIDIHNSGFRQINIGVQLSHKGDEPNEFVVQLKGSLPLATTSFDSAFSPNPAVPLYAAAQKKISPAAVSAAVGWRLRLAGAKTNDILTIIPMLGLRYERTGVAYSYDKRNYTVLNPDKTQQRFGFFGSFSVEYMHLLKKGRLFTQLTLATPAVGKKDNFPYSFRLMIPLSLNVGYSFTLKTGKHEKAKN